MTQSTQVRDALREHGVNCELVPMDSTGDQDRKTPLYEIETSTPGLFTKHLEKALLESRIDLAVHSLKDLPTQQPDALYVPCIPFRVQTGDCAIVAPGVFVEENPLGLAIGATVGTSSLRREAQILSCRPDIKIVPIRGNVPTRVRAVAEGKVDAVILAQAGIERLALDMGSLRKVALPEDQFVPAPGQGALAIETRRDVAEALRRALLTMNNANAESETRIERRVLRALEGGCTLPLGVRVIRESSGVFSLRAFLGLVEDREAKVREWLGFHHFDIRDADEEVVVDRTVEFFKEIMK
jgi:hydroxymethylbilane synthase